MKTVTFYHSMICPRCHMAGMSLSRLLPDFPDRLTVVSATGPMWRGGLSAPASLYIHADLPLISDSQLFFTRQDFLLFAR